MEGLLKAFIFMVSSAVFFLLFNWLCDKFFRKHPKVMKMILNADKIIFKDIK